MAKNLNRLRLTLLGSACLALAGAAPTARAQKAEQLRPQGYVSDFAGVIDENSKAQIAALCAEVNQKAQAQLAVVTVPSLQGEAIEDFSIQLAARWGIGPKGNDRGVLILLAPQDHKYRIEVGYGLEPILPDGKVGGFGREAVPLLRAGNYGAALLLLTERVANVIAQERGVTLTSTPAAPPSAEPEEGPRGSGLRTLLILLLVFGIPTLRWLLPLFFFGALGGLGRRRRGFWMGGPWIGGWGGGSWGGGGMGSGGGGFGGFGGGSFGGGGASGGW